jgi:hypothetical protein
VFRLELFGELEEDRHHVGAPGDVEAPLVEVHRLRQALTLEQRPVVGVMPVLEDLRSQLVTGDEQPALVVGREVERADHVIAAALAQPGEGGVEQRLRDRGVVLGLEEPELTPVVVLELVEPLIDLGADPPDDPAVTAGEEVLGLGVLEVGVVVAVEVALALADQRRHPLVDIRVEPEREHDELPQVGSAGDGSDGDLTHRAPTLSPLSPARCRGTAPSGSRAPRRPRS